MNSIRRAVLRARFLPKNRSGGELRAYRTGEEGSAIDWRATARSGSIYVRERSRDAIVTWGAVTDASPSMKAGRNRSLSAAAAEARDFWRACALPGDRWIDMGPVACHALVHQLECALRMFPAHGALLVAGDYFDLPEVPYALLRTASQRLDCTALVASDPWRESFPLKGFVVVTDLETTRTRRLFIGPRERSNFKRACRARERAVLALLREAGWRAALMREDDGARSVRSAFRSP